VLVKRASQNRYRLGIGCFDKFMPSTLGYRGSVLIGQCWAQIVRPFPETSMG